jgi:hypothetical protein
LAAFGVVAGFFGAGLPVACADVAFLAEVGFDLLAGRLVAIVVRSPD